jgi:3-hydroxybutyryl-CoA dehydratase
MQVGDIIEHTFVIDEDTHRQFIALSGDSNPLHTNRDFARGKGFPDIVMHGNILNCFISFLIGELLPQDNVMILSQEIKFIKPVFLNETLLLHAEIREYFEFIPGYEIKFRFRNNANENKASGVILIKLL